MRIKNISFQLKQSISIQKKETIFKVNCIFTIRKSLKKRKIKYRSQCVIDQHLPFKSFNNFDVNINILNVTRHSSCPRASKTSQCRSQECE